MISKNSICRRNCLILFIVLIFQFSLYSVEDSNLKDKIDTAFMRQSESDLTKILLDSKTNSNYSEVENYVLAKSRECLIYNRLEYAQFATLSLIDINLDNFDALDLYTRISQALSDRVQIEQKKEEIRLAQVAQEKVEAEEVRENFEKDFSQTVTGEGANVYFTAPEDIRYSPFNWSAQIGLIGLSFMSTPSVNSLKFGVEGNGEFFYNTDTIGVGAEAKIATHMISFVGSENFIFDFKIVPAISFYDLSRNAYFRLGFTGMFGDPIKDGTSVKSFLSPLIGFEWKNINVGSTKSRVYFDYLFGHFAYDELKAAFDLGWRTIIPFSDQGHFSINSFIDFTDTVIITGVGVENNVKLTIGFGVGNYE